jgi:hypothetical protein
VGLSEAEILFKTHQNKGFSETIARNHALAGVEAARKLGAWMVNVGLGYGMDTIRDSELNKIPTVCFLNGNYQYGGLAA